MWQLYLLHGNSTFEYIFLARHHSFAKLHGVLSTLCFFFYCEWVNSLWRAAIFEIKINSICIGTFCSTSGKPRLRPHCQHSSAKISTAERERVSPSGEKKKKKKKCRTQCLRHRRWHYAKPSEEYIQNMSIFRFTYTLECNLIVSVVILLVPLLPHRQAAAALVVMFWLIIFIETLQIRFTRVPHT